MKMEIILKKKYDEEKKMKNEKKGTNRILI